MRNHYYIFNYTLYFFGQPAPDKIDLFYGLGLAHVETTLRTGFREGGTLIPITESTVEYLHKYKTQMPIVIRRLGIGSTAENFGVVFEVYFLDNSKILDNPFYGSSLIDTQPLEKEISVGGIILRLGVTYSFF